MNTKTMEGLLGARINIDMVNTPFRVYKEARREGNTAAMERAMGYVNDFEDAAGQYKLKADEGMKEDAEQAREKRELEREEAIEKRREEREKFQEKLEEDRTDNQEDTAGRKDIDPQDKVEISEDGQNALKEDPGMKETGMKVNHPDTTEAKPVIYTCTKAAEVAVQAQEVTIGIQVDCSV